MSMIQKKICMLGDFAVGKTSLVRRFVDNFFDDRYLSTIGVKISRKEMVLSGDVTLRFLIWDLAGREKYTGVQTSYLQGASGALLVCDLTRKDTVPFLRGYADRLREVNVGAPLVLMANKSDLVGERRVTDEELEKVAKDIEAPCLITSAKTGEGVREAFDSLARQMIEEN